MHHDKNMFAVHITHSPSVAQRTHRIQSDVPWGMKIKYDLLSNQGGERTQKAFASIFLDQKGDLKAHRRLYYGR